MDRVHPPTWRVYQRRLRRRTAGRRLRPALLVAGGLGLAAAVGISACATPPPRALDDACAMLNERPSWYRALRFSEREFGVPVEVQLAVVHQESRFRSDARPPRTKLFWVLPGPRPSSAYGYGQIIDSTWDRYRVASGRRGADRDDFPDVAHFIGWYGAYGAERYRIPKDDAAVFYLAYHEGHGGYARGTHANKRWLRNVAAKVARRSARYATQLGTCRGPLDERIDAGWWPF